MLLLQDLKPGMRIVKSLLILDSVCDSAMTVSWFRSKP
jgi:hypothetical protein